MNKIPNPIKKLLDEEHVFFMLTETHGDDEIKHSATLSTPHTPLVEVGSISKKELDEIKGFLSPITEPGKPSESFSIGGYTTDCNHSKFTLDGKRFKITEVETKHEGLNFHTTRFNVGREDMGDILFNNLNIESKDRWIETAKKSEQGIFVVGGNSVIEDSCLLHGMAKEIGAELIKLDSKTDIAELAKTKKILVSAIGNSAKGLVHRVSSILEIPEESITNALYLMCLPIHSKDESTKRYSLIYLDEYLETSGYQSTSVIDKARVLSYSGEANREAIEKYFGFIYC